MLLHWQEYRQRSALDLLGEAEKKWAFCAWLKKNKEESLSN